MSETKLEPEVSFKENGNEAWLKFESAEPLSAYEASIIANVKLDIWEPVNQEINLWTMGRKDKKVYITWTDGKANGFVDDSGKIHKAYMYQIKVKFERKKRIAVEPVIHPIVIKSSARKRKAQIVDTSNKTRVLFITDPHFGFRVKPFEKPVTFHSRPFLSDLLALCVSLQPDLIVWGGDILDLADFSRWPKEPELMQQTQIAAIEAAWVINQFGLLTPTQEFIEGNHDIRLLDATAKNFASAYGLKPIHDLEGPAMLSIPRLLDLDTARWHGNYPDGYFDYGNIRFEHGNRAPNASGATVTALHKESLRSLVFGHIHRYELAWRHIQGEEMPIVMASPGCACRKETTPGASRKRNWTIGAFYMTFKDGEITKNIEHISHEDGETWFRGEQYKGISYLEKMGKDIPDKYMQAL